LQGFDKSRLDANVSRGKRQRWDALSYEVYRHAEVIESSTGRRDPQKGIFRKFLEYTVP
jgi:hypothetical protein